MSWNDQNSFNAKLDLLQKQDRLRKEEKKRRQREEAKIKKRQEELKKQKTAAQGEMEEMMQSMGFGCSSSDNSTAFGSDNQHSTGFVLSRGLPGGPGSSSYGFSSSETEGGFFGESDGRTPYGSNESDSDSSSQEPPPVLKRPF